MAAPSWLMGQQQNAQNGGMTVDEKATAMQKALMNGEK